MMSGGLPAAEARLTEAWQEALADPEPGWVAVLAGTFLAAIINPAGRGAQTPDVAAPDRKSTRLNSRHPVISYAVLCLKKKNTPMPLGPMSPIIGSRNSVQLRCATTIPRSAYLPPPCLPQAFDKSSQSPPTHPRPKSRV